MMTGSATRTAEFTITDARQVGAKIGADLRLLNGLYGRPALASIGDYVEEAAALLNKRYLRTIDYGFHDSTSREWKLRLRYTATTGGHLLDSRPGALPTTAAVAGYGFYSYLTYSAAFHEESPTKRLTFLAGLPVQRVSADEPAAGAGSHLAGHGYARNGVGVTRDIYTAC